MEENLEISCKPSEVETKYYNNQFVTQDSFVEYQRIHAECHQTLMEGVNTKINSALHEVDCLDGRLSGVASAIRQESVERDKKLESWLVVVGIVQFAMFCMLVVALY